MRFKNNKRKWTLKFAFLPVFIHETDEWLWLEKYESVTIPGYKVVKMLKGYKLISSGYDTECVVNKLKGSDFFIAELQIPPLPKNTISTYKFTSRRKQSTNE